MFRNEQSASSIELSTETLMEIKMKPVKLKKHKIENRIMFRLKALSVNSDP